VGDRVRVKRGVMDPDYPEFPLGGWAGSIVAVHPGERTCTVRWNAQTLRGIHPIYKKRCERDGLGLEECVLSAMELEPDRGGPPAIEQPTRINARPLSLEHQADRVRAAFRLTSDDPLPEVSPQSLRKYRHYLGKLLSLPLEATYEDEDEPGRIGEKVVVIGPDRNPEIDRYDGILCEVRRPDGTDLVPLARIRPESSGADRQLIADYAAWFYEEVEDEAEADFEDEDETDPEDLADVEEVARFAVWFNQSRWRSLGTMVLNILGLAAVCGAVFGSAFAAMPWTRWGALAGAALVGVGMASLHRRDAWRDWPIIRPKFQQAVGSLIGAVFGMLLGGFLGTAVLAAVGPLSGWLIGAWIERRLPRRRGISFVILPGPRILGAGCGLAAQALCWDRLQATAGLGYGALAGLGVGVLLVLAVFFVPLIACTEHVVYTDRRW
jgi:hypothetical protein